MLFFVVKKFFFKYYYLRHLTTTTKEEREGCLENNIVSGFWARMDLGKQFENK